MLVSAALKSLTALDGDAALAAVRDAGLNSIELEIETLDRLRQRLADYQVQVTTLAATASDPSSADWLDRVTFAIRAAAEWASIILVSAGDDHGDRQMRERLLLQHRRAADVAAEHDMVLAWDTLPGLCGDARGMQLAIQEVDHPAIRLNFDTGRYLQQNPWSSGEVGLQRVVGHLASVRLTSFTVGVEPVEFPPLGQGGEVDFSRTGQILSGLEFRGPCTIAFQPFSRRPPTAAQCQSWLRASVDHLRGCGWFE